MCSSRVKGKHNDDMVKLVVKKISEVAGEAEDVIDTYIVKVSLQKSRNIVKKLLHCTSHELMLRDVDAEIERIKTTIDEIYRNKERFGVVQGEFQSGGGDEAEKEVEESLRRRRKDVEEEVVGFVHDSNTVIKHVLETNSCLNVVSIIGMGGLGKTTLAKKIYNKMEVKKTFSCCAWGYVSNEYRAKELLLSLVQCLMGSISSYQGLSEEELKEKVRDYLKGKKYLVVLDDIWKTQDWDDLQGAFPDDNMGSRILITSRIKEVATYARSTLVHYLPLLNEKESWELFCNKVFSAHGGIGSCPSELKDLGMTIVARCGGLPLAIVVLAGLVSKKEKTVKEWLRIESGVSWHLDQEDNMKVMGILKLSYDNLPSELKPCFLYLGMFPEDYEIQVKDLIRLWIAEGFIHPPKTGTSPKVWKPEDIAEYYLDGLVDRNLVQVVSRRSIDGSAKTCRIHDLLRDLCISESSNAGNFFELYSVSQESLCNPRRLSISCPK